jgi:hypothetical protein
MKARRGETTVSLITKKPSGKPADRLRERLPLVPADKLSSVTHYVMSDHAIERCEERGVGIMEVYSTIADPQFTQPSRRNDVTTYIRGDLKVSVTDHTIVTVIDLEEDHRTTPRVPLNPLISKGAAKMSARNGVSSSGLDDTWCLLAHPKPDIRLIVVTPALAEKLLSLNSHNRPFTKTLVAQYEADIENDQWKLTHQGVALDTTPALQDGQHRLQAIVNTGKAQPMYVAVGMDPANFAVIDVGRNRKFSDVLSMEGYTDTNNLGATARLVFLYLHRNFVSTHKVSNASVVELVGGDPKNFMLAMAMGRTLATNVMITRSAAGAGYYLIKRVNAATPVNEFFDSLVTGENLPTGDPRPKLRKVIATQARERRRNGPEQLALLIKAWNAWAEGREVGVLSWRRTEQMPRVTRYERQR